MTSIFKKYSPLFFILILFIGMVSAKAQTTDMPGEQTQYDNALQFQLIGGIGINYYGKLTAPFSYRIGADLFLSMSDESGNGRRIYDSYSSSSSSHYSATRDTKPKRETDSYNLILSGLSLYTFVENKPISIYAGAGPAVSYSWYRTMNEESIILTNGSDASTSTSISEGTEKSVGVGPLVIAGVKSMVIENIGVSAEIAASALYEWTDRLSSYSSSSGSSPTSFSVNKESSITKLSGWNISISSVRVGIMVGL